MKRNWERDRMRYRPQTIEEIVNPHVVTLPPVTSRGPHFEAMKKTILGDMIYTELKLILVEPQPTYIENSGRWRWPLPEAARFPGCCKEVLTASREWWEYAPSEAKPHPMAEGVRLRDDVWYWAVPK